MPARVFSEDLFDFEDGFVPTAHPLPTFVAPNRRTQVATTTTTAASSSPIQPKVPAVSPKDAQVRRWVQSHAFTARHNAPRVAPPQHRSSSSTSTLDSLQISVFDTDSEDEEEEEDDDASLDSASESEDSRSLCSVSVVQSDSDDSEDEDEESSAIYMNTSSSSQARNFPRPPIMSIRRRILSQSRLASSSSPSPSSSSSRSLLTGGLRPLTPARQAAPALIVDLRVPATSSAAFNSYPPRVIQLEEVDPPSMIAESASLFHSSIDRLPSLTSSLSSSSSSSSSATPSSASSASSSDSESDGSRYITIHPVNAPKRPLRSPPLLWSNGQEGSCWKGASPIREKVEQDRGRTVARRGRVWV